MVQWFLNLRLSTKALLSVLSAFSILWATPSTHDLIVQIVGPHPRITALLALIAGGYAILHNPNPVIEQSSK